MNAIFAQCVPSQFKAVVLAQLIAGVTVAVSSLAVHAQTVDIDTVSDVQPITSETSSQPLEATSVAPLKPTHSLVERLQSRQASLVNHQSQPQALATATPENLPVPGTTATSSAPLTQLPVAPQAAESTSDNPKVAQIFVDPGLPTIGGSSYVGVAGNIGLSDNGSTALGGGNFANDCKIGLTNTLSTRPSVVLGDNAIILVPVTYDFSFQPVGAFTDPLPIAPYVGGGVAISTGKDSTFGGVLTGGIDVPITSQLTATAALNVAFVDILMSDY